MKMKFIYLQVTLTLFFWTGWCISFIVSRVEIFALASEMPQNDGDDDADPHNPYTIVWNHQTETAEQLQGRLCPTRCNGTKRVNRVHSLRCMRCFPCTCHQHCDKYGTCCPQDGDPWQTPPIERAECRQADIGWILQVTTCDPAYPHNQTRFLCESKALPRRRDTVLPVTSRATGVTYANRHCAQCHHDLSHSEEWTMTCRHNQYLYNITNDTLYDDSAILLPDICRITVPSSIHVSPEHLCSDFRSYYDSTVITSTCNVTGRWKEESEHVRKACEESEWSRGEAVRVSSHHERVGSYRMYANVLCAMCNDPDLLNLDCPWIPIVTFPTSELVPSFFIPEDVLVGPEILVCSQKQWKHPRDGCQKLQCSAGKVLGPDNTCITPVKRITGLGYRLRMLLLPVSVTVNLNLATINLKSKSSLPPSNLELPVAQASSTPPKPSELRTSSASPTAPKSLTPLCSYSHNIKQATGEKFSSQDTFRCVTITTTPTQDDTCFFTIYKFHMERLWTSGNKTCWPLDGTKERCEMLIDDKNRHAALFLAAIVEVDMVSSPRVRRDALETEILRAIFQHHWTVVVDRYEVKLKALDLTTGLCDILVEHALLGDTAHFAYINLVERENPLEGLEHLFLPLSKSLLCPHLSFSDNEFEMKKSGRGFQISFPIYLDSEMKPLSFSTTDYPNEVWLDENQQLSMCFGTFQEVFPQNVTVIKPGPGVSKVRQILSVVCGSVSVVCLALTFFTYSLFRELRSLPGLNNMGLSLSLATAQMSLFDWLRNPGIKPLCTSVGVFTHWLWLMAILWMGVCCLHMRHVFTSKTRHTLTQREAKKAFLHNILFTVLGSAGIVIITIVVSASVSGGSSLGYGGWKCFLDISLHRLLILAFVVPLGVVVLTNLVCFFFTVVAIVRMRRLRAEDRSGRGSRQVLIYAKLSTVTGAGWVLALLGQVHRSEWMLVLTELCTGLQGLLIFLAYVCNRRVWNLYRSKCSSSCRR